MWGVGGVFSGLGGGAVVGRWRVGCVEGGGGTGVVCVGRVGRGGAGVNGGVGLVCVGGLGGGVEGGERLGMGAGGCGV